jgi:glyoxylase-like metal-dependent hydrolase (beta-lactamase superfamily II)
VVDSLNTNCYLLTSEKTSEAIVIDTDHYNIDKVLREIKKRELTLKNVINTHGHPDHTGGNRFLKDATDAKILIHEMDPQLFPQFSIIFKTFGLKVETPPPAERFITDKECIQFGNDKLRVIHTPGHSPGSISLYSEKNRILLSGDTLLKGFIGRTDLPGSSHEEMS